VARAPVQ